MNAYFFKMTNEERENILDQHKHLYDGYVTKYNQESNMTPLYVQDLANDKNGITLNNKGEVKTYRNVGINESPLDRIADGDTDLENGTVDLDDANNDREEVDAIIDNDRYPSPSEDDSLRDFAGEMLEKYQDLKLLKYGFSYFRDDPMQDDITWFLLEK